MAAEILLVDDDRAFLDIVARTLADEGFRVTAETSGRRAVDLARERSPRLVVLDLVMPGLRGLEVCQALKQDSRTAAIPILILTGNDAEGQDVSCLDLGADDYLTKPVRSERLLAHCRALLRRTEPAPPAKGSLTVGAMTLDYARKAVTIDGRVHDELTPKEFDLLYHLARHPGEPHDRAALYREVWGSEPPSDGSLKTVEVHVRRIRLKLRLKSDRWLLTTPGRGYSLVAPV